MIGKPAGLALVLLAITMWTSALPVKDTTTRRSPQPTFADTMKQLTNQLMNISADITLDTRTPPKIKQMLRKPIRNREKTGSSHPGVAVPINDSDLLLEESTKKLNFYKIENKPTTDGGLSTWVLLSSQTASPSYTTTKTSRKPVTRQKPGENKNVTLIDSEIFNKITKPLFKKRPALSTTQKPTTITEKGHKPTKVKPLSLSNPNNNKTKNDLKTSNKKNNESIPVELLSTVKPTEKLSTVLYTSTREAVQKIEAKDGEIELMTTTQSSKKTRRPTVTPKRKKNKKRRRPALEKSDTTNSTRLALKSKEKPISTQIYNYLSREIIPTVSVGLVGLVVTAGLASYFLYPFGVARRSYEIDRKDKEEMHYYSDEYAPGGIAEEEVIGKVIAGMPVNNYEGYRMPAGNVRHKQNEYGFRKPSQSSPNDAVYLTPTMKYGDDDHFRYRNHKLDFYNPYQDVIEHNQETGYTVDDTKFLVGAKEVQEVTPVAVPEHGPRNLPESKSKEGTSQFKVVAPRRLQRNKSKFRRRRSNEKVNKIDGKIDVNHTGTAPPVTDHINGYTSESQSILKTLQVYLENTIRAGLEYFDTAGRTISKYLLQLQNRISNKTNRNDTVQNKEQPRED